MPAMMIYAKACFGQSLTGPSILLASDSARQGSSMHTALQGSGFPVHYAGDYSQLDGLLDGGQFDVVLLEVTGPHAVEPAVAAALRVKRANADQFVGYLADSELETSGLAGDAIFPRSVARLPEALRSFFLGNREE